LELEGIEYLLKRKKANGPVPPELDITDIADDSTTCTGAFVVVEFDSFSRWVLAGPGAVRKSLG